jgi:hypothetical protein
VARVNEESVTAEEFNQEFQELILEPGKEKKWINPGDLKKAYLDQMIERKILVQEAHRLGIKVSLEELNQVIQEIKTLQDHLGDLNDAQVATEILRNFLAGWDNLQEDLPVSERALPDAVMAYLSYRYAERQELMQSFPAAWERFNRPELRQLLAQAISVL